MKKVINKKIQQKNKTLVLSDVDGTIVKGSLVLGHACFLNDNGVKDFDGLTKEWSLHKKNENLISELGEKYRQSIIGMTKKELMIDDYLSDVEEKGEFYQTIDRINILKNIGADVVLISGSPQFLVKPIADQYGFTSVASDYRFYNGVFTGKIKGMFNYEAKQKVISNLDLGHYTNIVAFGDTTHDRPLFNVANHRVLVAPSRHNLNIMRNDVEEVVYK